MESLEYLIENCYILIPALNIIGMFIKDMSKIPDEYIPFILLVLSIAGSMLICGVNGEAVIKGVLVAGVAVYGNQAVKQAGKILNRKESDEDSDL